MFLLVFEKMSDSEKETATLQYGSWRTPKYWFDSNDEKQIDRNYKMVWQNTPFDQMAPLHDAGTYTANNNVGHVVMYDKNGTWNERFSFIERGILPLKRKTLANEKLPFLSLTLQK